MAGRRLTKFPGVYEREAKTKTLRGKPDIAFDITYRADGKKIWEKVGWLSEGYSAKLAADVRAERIRSLRHGEELPNKKKKTPTFKDVWQKYEKWATVNKKGIEDKSRYENHLKKRFHNKRFDEISPFDLERMKSEMTKEGYSPKTVSHCLGLVGALYNRASDWNLYQGPNPVKNVKKPVVRNQRQRFLSHEEADLLLAELLKTSKQLHDIALLSLHTGARASEIFNLKKYDIDFKNGLIALRDTKNKETRFAPMTETIEAILKKRMPTKSNTHIFQDRKGEKIKEVSNSFERVVKRLKLNEGVTDRRQKVVFHTLRHTFASWLAMQGVPLYTIASLLGHKTLIMTQRYSHLSPDHKKEAVRLLENSLNGSGKIAKIEKVEE